jgi:hypothetical protein
MKGCFLAFLILLYGIPVPLTELQSQHHIARNISNIERLKPEAIYLIIGGNSFEDTVQSMCPQEPISMGKI